jgi:hypothetical protein
LLLLDEVLCGLTASEIDKAIALVRNIRAGGTTIVFVEVAGLSHAFSRVDGDQRERRSSDPRPGSVSSRDSTSRYPPAARQRSPGEHRRRGSRGHDPRDVPDE